MSENDSVFEKTSQEYERMEIRDPPLNQRLAKILQDLAWRIYKKDKLEQVQTENMPPDVNNEKDIS